MCFPYLGGLSLFRDVVHLYIHIDISIDVSYDDIYDTGFELSQS